MKLGFLFIFKKMYQANLQCILSQCLILKEFLLNLIWKDKMLYFGSYELPSQANEYFFQVKNGIGMCSKFNGKFILLWDFSSQFLFEMNTKIIVEEPNCSKNLTNASRTDIAITNSSSSFQNTKTISTV